MKKTLTTLLVLWLTLHGLHAQQPSPPAGSAGEDSGELEDAAAAAPVMMLRMRTGAIHWGRILGHDPEAVRFQRIENGGQARLPWGMLDPELERELRLKFGYVDDSEEEILIDAERLVLIGGQEIVGVIVGRTQDDIVVKTSSGLIPVPKVRLAGGSTRVQVPALDIYSREELYNQQLSLTLEDSAASQFELAQYCERILAFAQAAEHYAKVAELDPDYRSDDVTAALNRSQMKAARQEEIDHLAEIEHLRKRKQYDKALAMVQSFTDRFPDSTFLDDLQRKRARVERSVMKDLSDKVVRRWHYWAGRLAREAGRTMTFEQALNYADEQLGQDILARVHKDLQEVTKDVEEADVRVLFEQREGGRWRRASYGYGTWLLGQDAALKGELANAEEDGEPQSERQREREDLEKKLERFLRNQEMVRKTKRQADQVEDHQAFWETYASASRMQWILAYYVENGGDFRVKDQPELTNCRECGGTGAREVVQLGGARTGGGSASSSLVPCPTCHQIGRVRRIRYR